MMKLLYIIMFIAFTYHSVNANNLWEMTFIIETNPQALECPDDKNIFIISTIGIICNFYKSVDNGSTWELVNKIDYYTIKDMSCIDSINCFLAFRDGTVYKTSDAGKSFESLKVAGINHTTNITMYNSNIGVLHNGWYITHDGWKTYDMFNIANENISYSYRHPTFINDSILYLTLRVEDLRDLQYHEPPINMPRISGHVNNSFMKLNINTLEYELFYIDHLDHLADFFVLNEKTLFACGSSNSLSGGSNQDAIYKSTNGGVTWRRVLDLYSHRNKFYDHNIPPFGLQSIAFKDSLTGIAVGQFGKILYTHDGGESWTYESKLHDSISKTTPPTMLVRYSDTIPVVATFTRHIYRMIEDNLAPRIEHKYSISGRVWEGDKGQAGVAIQLDTFRITMTDKDGYYRFGNLKEGNYQVRALNKYYDGGNPLYYYKPFDYTPLEYNIALTSDTTGFDFNAEDLRTFYKVEGYIVDDKGQGIPDIFLRTGSSTTTTDESGRFEFSKIESRLTFDVIPYSEELTFSPSSHRINLITGDTTDLLFTATPATSVWESANSSSIILHPNPAIEYIEIIPPLPKGDSELASRGIYDVKIFNTLGECVITTPSLRATPSEKGNLRIDVSHLPTGVYYISMGNKFDKFVVVR